MNLSQLHPPAGSRHRRKRVGRGPGSGLGKTAGRGENGQKSRSGHSMRRGFEGGQMPLIRRVPKRGFHNPFRTEFAIVNIGRLETLSGDEVTPQILLDGGVITSLRDGLKILGDGELKRALKVTAHRVSKSAREKIEAAGGKIELLMPPAPVREKPAPAPRPQKSAAPEAAARPADAKDQAAEPAAKAKASKPKAAAGKDAEAKPAKEKAAKDKAPKAKPGGEAKKK
jgi:large subunit ribosomal protein L15